MAMESFFFLFFWGGPYVVVLWKSRIHQPMPQVFNTLNTGFGEFISLTIFFFLFSLMARDEMLLKIRAPMRTPLTTTPAYHFPPGLSPSPKPEFHPVTYTDTFTSSQFRTLNSLLSLSLSLSLPRCMCQWSSITEKTSYKTLKRKEKKRETTTPCQQILSMGKQTQTKNLL